ncbi:MAG: diaminopimelate decarboxylase [Muribaculaceae bacterium]|nr:diaminopimelate decarboxylase [Muribaculaceae bacterium]
MNIDLSLAEGLKTPFYLYDVSILNRTLQEINKCIAGKPIKVHYAVKANCNPRILSLIAEAGLGADCVSGREVSAAIKAGFNPDDICYAGVGKTDRELILAMKSGIAYLNVESIEELEVLDNLALEFGYRPNICLRVNPNIDAHTHQYITTGLQENKFGINLAMLDEAVELARNAKSLNLIGLHFHIGSQITDMTPFALLCNKVNELVDYFQKKGVNFRVINVGGGLGIDYDDPDANPIPDFKNYFDTLLKNLKIHEGQEIHCELGRAVVAQCGSLISRVTFVKKGVNRKFIILDAGMNDLIRPALYGAHHKIQNVSVDLSDSESKPATDIYDVAGPICESSDVFGKDEELPVTVRGDIFALRSAGAYAECMASTYNIRPIPETIFVD